MNYLKQYLYGRSPLKKALDIVLSDIRKGLLNPPEDIKFVFLCGANKANGLVSARRQAIIDFAKTKLPHTQVFIAENLFEALTYDEKPGHGNLIDIEKEISAISDKIIIILESNSAFCELGAFSDKELRGKLIIINDSQFDSHNSFINKGPIAAIREQADGEKQILRYKMENNGINSTDAIGAVFKNLSELLAPRIPRTKSINVNISRCDPSEVFDVFSLKFIHDLIFLSGPINRIELIELFLTDLYGKKDFRKLSQILGMLVALKLIRKHNGNYISQRNREYYRYNFDTNKVLASFKNIHMKYLRERIF